MKKDYGARGDVKGHNEKYGMGGMGSMGHASKPMKCDPMAAQKADNKGLKMMKGYNNGYPSEAYKYNY